MSGPFDYTQMLITAAVSSGDQVDVTRDAKIQIEGNAIEVAASGLIKPVADGQATVSISVGQHTASVPIAGRGSGIGLEGRLHRSR